MSLRSKPLGNMDRNDCFLRLMQAARPRKSGSLLTCIEENAAAFCNFNADS
jgi:hypothetical protein